MLPYWVKLILRFIKLLDYDWRHARDWACYRLRHGLE